MTDTLFYIKKAKHWQEIESLKEEFKRNQNSITNLEKRQKCILDSINKNLQENENSSMDRDEFMYKNKLGEFNK